MLRPYSLDALDEPFGRIADSVDEHLTRLVEAERLVPVKPYAVSDEVSSIIESVIGVTAEQLLREKAA